jgi:hypothetical protein
MSKNMIILITLYHLITNMEKFKRLTLEQKIDQLKEDYQNDWWKPSQIDDYDVKKKVRFYIL